MSNNNLKNKVILITRPKHQALNLAENIEALGGKAILFPTLEIIPVFQIEYAPEFDEEITLDYVIFISANAVKYGLPILKQLKLSSNFKLICVGKGSQQALNQLFNQNVEYRHFLNYMQLIPNDHQFDSEGILALSDLKSPEINHKNIMIFKGIGGKKYLADQLKQRKANIYTCSCYERINPQINDLLLQPIASEISAVLISSSEGFQNFWNILSDELKTVFRNVLFVVIHKNILEKVKAHDIQTSIISETSDDGVISLLTESL